MTTIANNSQDMKTEIATMVRWAKGAHKESRHYFRKAKDEDLYSVRTRYEELGYSYNRQVDTILACARLVNGSFDRYSAKMRAARARKDAVANV